MRKLRATVVRRGGEGRGGLAAAATGSGRARWNILVRMNNICGGRQKNRGVAAAWFAALFVAAVAVAWARARTGLEDALVVAHGTIGGQRAVAAAMAFDQRRHQLIGERRDRGRPMRMQMRRSRHPRT